MWVYPADPRYKSRTPQGVLVHTSRPTTLCTVKLALSKERMLRPASLAVAHHAAEPHLPRNRARPAVAASNCKPCPLACISGLSTERRPRAPALLSLLLAASQTCRYLSAGPRNQPRSNHAV